MADATTPITVVQQENPHGVPVEIANGVTVYKGRYAGLRGPDHGTTQGYVDSYAAEEGMFFGGILESAGGLTEKAGDTTASPPPEAALLILPRILKRVTVTGVASRGDILKRVYCADNQTLTLTRPTLGSPVGLVINWHSGTTCDALFFGAAVQAAIDLGGCGQELICLGSFDVTIAASANLATGIPAPFHGEILEVFATIDGADLVGAGGSVDLNLEIAATNVTGGVVSLAIGSPTAGSKVAGTAVTAANVFHEGDLIDVEATVNTAFTTGRVNLYAVVARKPGV